MRLAALFLFMTLTGPLHAGRVGEWKGNSANGQFYDEVGNAHPLIEVDSSGNTGYTAIPNPSSPTPPEGNRGLAGRTTTTLAGSFFCNVSPNAAEGHVVFWQKVDMSAGFSPAAPFFFYDDDESNYIYLTTAGSAGAGNHYYECGFTINAAGTGGALMDFQTRSILDDGLLHEITVDWNGQGVRGYVDGVLDGSVAVVPNFGTGVNTQADKYNGFCDLTGAGTWTFLVDDIRLYDNSIVTQKRNVPAAFQNSVPSALRNILPASQKKLISPSNVRRIP